MPHETYQSLEVKMYLSGDDLQQLRGGKSRKKIAIIGSGISGLGAAWHLQNHCDVEIFESEDQIGGHSHSVRVDNLWLDMGFIVFNEPCYPNLIALFDHIKAEHQLSDMSFAVSADNGGFEYSSLGLGGLFAQKSNLISPKFYQMIGDILRFNQSAPHDYAAREDFDLTLGQYLVANQYSDIFIHNHLLLQAAAIWSASAGEIMAFPFAAFIRFFENHGLLQISDRILWRSLIGGAQAYLARLTDGFKGQIHTKRPIKAIIRQTDKIIVIDDKNQHSTFDEIIMATHADTSIKILGDAATKDEKEILGAIKYSKNTVVLHTDDNFMPRRKNAWASWNYITTGRQDRQLCVSYWMNLLQRLYTDKNYFVTLNPIRQIAPDKIIKQLEFDHPFYDVSTLKAQKRLPKIQGVDRVWFCGAYFGYGFHEDGLQSGLAVAEALSGFKRPWAFDWAKSRIAFEPISGLQNA